MAGPLQLFLAMVHDSAKVALKRWVVFPEFKFKLARIARGKDSLERGGKKNPTPRSRIRDTTPPRRICGKHSRHEVRDWGWGAEVSSLLAHGGGRSSVKSS